MRRRPPFGAPDGAAALPRCSGGAPLLPHSTPGVDRFLLARSRGELHGGIGGLRQFILPRGDLATQEIVEERGIELTK